MEKLSLRILLVETDEDLLFVTSEMLRVSGYDVRAARTGTAALDLAVTFAPELAIVAVALPDMTGLQLAAKLERPQLPPLRLIALSGSNDAVLCARYLRHGFSHFFVKPFSILHLMHVLDGMSLTQARLSTLGLR